MVDRSLRWLHLDLDSYFASVEQQEQPRLRGLPVAVAPVGTPSGTIIAASYEAKAFGVHTGHRVREARALCPGLICTPTRHELYVQYHEHIIAEVWRHIPVTHVCSIDEVACRLLDNENAPDVAAALGRRIKAGIRANVGDQLKASVGIAPNRLVAKIACDMEKPDGLTVIETVALPQALFGLGLRDIPGIGARTAERMAKHGIDSIEALCAHAPAEAGTATGAVTGDRLWWRLHGHDFADAPAKSKSIGHSHVLAPDHRDLETVRLTARRLLLKAASRLRRGAYRTTRLVLHARLEHSGDWRHEVRLPATDDSFVLVSALAQLWPTLAQMLADRGARVRTIGVTLANVHSSDPEQAALPGVLDGPKTPTERLSRALDQINTRFGRNTVTLGPRTRGRADNVGTKIAFGRIPEAAEFNE